MATRWRVLRRRKARKARLEQASYTGFYYRPFYWDRSFYSDGYPDRDEDYFDGECDGDCYWCGGDGFIDGYEDDPLWFAPGELERCSSCGGSGRAKDMTIW